MRLLGWSCIFSVVEGSVQPWRLWIYLYFFFLLRRRGQCWLSSGSWPFSPETRCTCCTHSALSSCTTGGQNLHCTWGKQVIIAREERRQACFSPHFERKCAYSRSFNSRKECVRRFYQWTMLLAINDIASVWMGRGVMVYHSAAVWNMDTCNFLMYRSREDTSNFIVGLLNCHFDRCDWTWGAGDGSRSEIDPLIFLFL